MLRMAKAMPHDHGESADLKQSPAECAWCKESCSDLLRVLARAANDPGFGAQLTCQGSAALAAYNLTMQERAALLSGDIGWIERHFGRLGKHLEKWLWRRLCQEIW